MGNSLTGSHRIIVAALWTEVYFPMQKVKTHPDPSVYATS
jgi:hypothetical protein